MTTAYHLELAWCPPELGRQPAKARKDYIAALKRMSGEQRHRTAIELREQTRALVREELRSRFPNLSAEQLHAMCIERIKACHNSNY